MLRIVVVCAVAASILGGVPEPRLPRPQLDGRIVGGRPADIRDYPYQASLEYYGSHICGGSIISPKTIVTASHCIEKVPPSSLRIRAGSSIRERGGQVVGVARIHQHPQYNSFTKDYDISVLILSRPLIFDASVQPIALPAQNQNVPAGANAAVTGWGYTDENGSLASQLQVLDLPVISQSTCKSAYGSSAITDRMLCAGFTYGGKDACQGDSGGPLVFGGQLVGVVSWGYGCARPYYPGVYASVPNLRDYIREVSGI